MKAHSIKEFRIVMPLTVAEYNIGQLWSVMELSKYQTGGGEGVQILVNEPFTATINCPIPSLTCNSQMFTKGQFTHKIYHVSQQLPHFIRMFAPKGLTLFHERAWNAYPYARTVITNPEYMKDDFYIYIESYHLDDNGNSPNVHGLTGRDLQQRQIVKMDIANDPVPEKDYRAEWDPCLKGSTRANRPPLRGDRTGAWMSRVQPVMCCYKLVKVWFKWWGVQQKMETYLLAQEHRLFLTFHRQVFCWLDRYYGLTIEDLRKMEEVTRKELDENLKKGRAHGLVLEAN